MINNIFAKLLLTFILGTIVGLLSVFTVIFTLLFCWNEKISSFFLYLDGFVWKIDSFIYNKLKL